MVTAIPTSSNFARRMLAITHLTLSMSLPAKPVVAGKQFHRATDLLSSEPSASAVDVVNVLGRWSTYAQAHRLPLRAQRRESSQWQRDLVADTPGARALPGASWRAAARQPRALSNSLIDAEHM